MGTRSFCLHGDVFKIILKDVDPESQDLSGATAGAKAGATAGATTGATTGTNTRSIPANTPERPEYFIHKALLSSLSPELHKHANNDMKEGKENLIELSEVDEPTLKAFLEWAYFQDYQHPLPRSSTALLHHTKLYVLADRFNITLLKDFAFSKIAALHTEIGMVSERADLLATVAAVTYAYDNLLAYSGSLSDSGPPRERLLRYFAQYIAWALEIFRYNDEFIKLLVGNSDFAEAVVVCCSPALVPPWIQDTIAKASESRVASTGSEKITLDTVTDSNHLLYRKCSCGYTGVMGIQCAACNGFDDQVGTSVQFHKSPLGTVGAGRISGTRTNLKYTCKWCQAANTYGTATQQFSNYSSQLWKAYLWCRKCHTRGYQGNIN